MGWSILLNPEKTEMEFGIFKFNKDKDPNDPDEPLQLDLQIQLTKKDVQHLIKDLRNWEHIMELK